MWWNLLHRLSIRCKERILWSVELYFGSILSTLCHTPEASIIHTNSYSQLSVGLQTGLQKRFGDILNFDDVHNNNKMWPLLLIHTSKSDGCLHHWGRWLKTCFLLKSLDLGKVAADHKPMTKLIPVKTSTALQYARLRLWGCWLWMQGWSCPVFEWSITWTWAAEEVSSSRQSVCQVQQVCSIIHQLL